MARSGRPYPWARPGPLGQYCRSRWPVLVAPCDRVDRIHLATLRYRPLLLVPACPWGLPVHPVPDRQSPTPTRLPSTSISKLQSFHIYVLSLNSLPSTRSCGRRAPASSITATNREFVSASAGFPYANQVHFPTYIHGKTKLPVPQVSVPKSNLSNYCSPWTTMLSWRDCENIAIRNVQRGPCEPRGAPTWSTISWTWTSPIP